MIFISRSKTPETGAPPRRSDGAGGAWRRIFAGPRAPRPGPARSERWAARMIGLVMLGFGALIAAIGLLLLGVALEARWSFYAAISAPPPPPAPLRAEASPIPGRFAELALRAQLDRPRAYLAAGGAVWMAPLYPPEAERPAEPVRAMVFERAGAVSEAAFARWVVSVGRAGTLVELRGEAVDPHPGLRRQAAAALRAEGLTLAKDAVFLDPFQESRAEELAPSRLAVPFALGVLGGGAGMVLIGVWRRRRDRKRAEREGAERRAAAAEKAPETPGGAPETTDAPKPAASREEPTA